MAKYDKWLYNEWSSKNTTSLDSAPRKNDRYIWNCRLDHDFICSIQERLSGRKCPYCLNKKVLKGFNDLATTHPEIASFWNDELNEITPDSVTAGSDKKVWWKCTNGEDHSFQAEVFRLKSGRGCSICAGKVITEFNSLASRYPEVAKYFDSEKNGITPDKISYGSSKKYFWFDDLGHSYKKSPKSRVKGSACPYCTSSNTKLLSGFNDLATLFPDVAKDWDYKKNKTSPDKVLSKTKKRVWWLCSKGHSWSCPIGNRTGSHSGCPHCASNGTSNLEKEIIAFIKSVISDEDVSVRDRQLLLSIHCEVDAYIPSLQIAVEFNGLYWHSKQAGKDDNYHYDKWLACRNKGVRLITIWEDDWRDRPNAVKSFLSSALKPESNTGKNNSIVKINNNDAKRFTNNDCLSSCIITNNQDDVKYIGSCDNNGVIKSLLSYSIEDKNCYIHLYGDSGNFKSLVEHIVHICQGSNVSTITTHSDNDISDESVYVEIGFSLKNDCVSNNWVVNPFDDCSRQNLSDYTLFRFENDPDLLFEEGKSVDDLVDLNKMWMIHGSGLSEWVLHL